MQNINSAVSFLYWYMNLVSTKQEVCTTAIFDVGLDVYLLLVGAGSCSGGDLHIADATLHNVLEYSRLYRMFRTKIDNLT